MRVEWLLPPEKQLLYSGHEWLLRLIDSVDDVVASRLVLILWRAWFIRNEITHSNRKLSITSSAKFLLNYWETLCSIRHEDSHIDAKGKRPAFIDHVAKAKLPSEHVCWVPPEEGMIKINVDGAFVEGDSAGYGLVIRDDKGDVQLSAWGMVHYAASAEEVELIACREGVKLAAEWVPRPAILESDCLVAINFLRRPGDQRSQSCLRLCLAM
ncbi:hypothetical protein HU200_005031 [Digitaria exilis]|uniref:RNase H type-1 domain-containing protein n=1 Tax=Digitaria exilis TaxID=1010633 RepID=A0A835KWT6_9POAL|nr:hypothetical protein HU200_005031 [Digitaria exilis]